MFKETKNVPYGDYTPVLDRDYRNPENSAQMCYYGKLTDGSGTLDKSQRYLFTQRKIQKYVAFIQSFTRKNFRYEFYFI